MASDTGSTNPPSAGGFGLRARLVAAFVAIAALATLVAALLTSVGLHTSFDSYLERRTADAAAQAVRIAETTYADEGRWTPDGLDLLAHELVLTGYDFRLVADGRTLLDTTKLERTDVEFRRVSTLSVRGPAGADVGELELYALGPEGNMPADDELVDSLDRAHLLAAGVAAVVAIIAGLVVAGRLSRPLRTLAATARGLAAGGPPPEPTSGSREVRELSGALGHLADDLSRQQRARRQLAQDLSHELRTPLMLLQSRIEAMQDGVVPFDAEGLAALHTETLRLSRLVSQIELLAESEASPPPLDDDVVMFDEVAREAHATLAAAFEIRGLTLHLDVRPTPARGDRGAVGQIVMNLLSNALKYAPEGSRVEVSARPDGQMASLRVRDEGENLPAGAEDRLFERFYRSSDAASKSGGVGLGLTIARNLAEAQGGSLTLSSAPDGTVFTLSLPSAPAPSVSEARAGSTTVSTDS
jgi:two-component system sensor histidine kinase BaeS